MVTLNKTTQLSSLERIPGYVDSVKQSKKGPEYRRLQVEGHEYIVDLEGSGLSGSLKFEGVCTTGDDSSHVIDLQDPWDQDIQLSLIGWDYYIISI